jgi:voltage-gated potassium channel
MAAAAFGGPGRDSRSGGTGAMTSNEPRRPIKGVEKKIAFYRPIRSLCMIDVLRDRDSWPVLSWALLTLLLGTLVYHWLEGWNYLDALYFSVISLATIGYGDFVPTTQVSRAFTIVYVINGIVILLALFDRIRIVRTQRVKANAAESAKISNTGINDDPD